MVLLPAACSREVTVHDVQQGRLPAGRCVDIEGVVVTGIGSDGLYVQEPQTDADGQWRGEEAWSGVWVSLGGSKLDVAEGDLVDISGCVAERSGMTVIDASGQTNPVRFVAPTVAIVPRLTLFVGDLTDPVEAERWEGVLVGVTSVGVRSVDEAVGEFEVEDANLGDGQPLVVGDKLYAWYEDLSVGDESGFVEIDGLLDQDGGRYKLQPRRLSDYPYVQE